MSRIGEAERDDAVRRLKEAYGDGLLTHEELTERLDRALTAGNRGELAAALETLPDGTASLTAVSGRIRRRGRWRVPRVLKVESALARVHLDLSRAVIDHPVVEIELRLGTGRARITVPRDAVVDLEDLRAGLKAPRYRGGTAGREGGPRIRISGAMGTGRLTIRHAWTRSAG
ncbi:DUF1707 domain-containing protein [Nonomuraea sp. NPDC050328]|uniref:DUF1707 domain-containing protein n=1 Tax=Nonomuraea sp. NPDC050328 TaxID=3364361 RepID=UPI0037B90B7F